MVILCLLSRLSGWDTVTVTIRSEPIGARVYYVSSPGEGTTSSLCIPLPALIQLRQQPKRLLIPAQFHAVLQEPEVPQQVL